ncbi:F0F1 ATP synthase subunit delta [Hydromonas duriensis]|uniref:ATP synthase subunit delta n=1 Tax=Hydromonas duriensis TaxID=1527608 RepID=A0A4R6Y359_9BURK|nr:F0F1 ATP synthase subunit delta [Hydromonas duriensis]TDR30986.1 ATP synthase F1 subcomplex delta subunit [Hydromonas duriensis]
MAELSTIARPYAQAAFDVAKAESALSAWNDFLSAAATAASQDEIRQLAKNPSVTSFQLIDIFEKVVAPSTASMRNFLGAVVSANRVDAFPAIAHAFSAHKHAFEGSADAYIVSAFPLEASQAKELVSALEKKLSKKLNPTLSVDASLIGGFCVTVGDEVLDMSVRAKLARMQSALTA